MVLNRLRDFVRNKRIEQMKSYAKAYMGNNYAYMLAKDDDAVIAVIDSNTDQLLKDCYDNGVFDSTYFEEELKAIVSDVMGG